MLGNMWILIGLALPMWLNDEDRVQNCEGSWSDAQVLVEDSDCEWLKESLWFLRLNQVSILFRGTLPGQLSVLQEDFPVLFLPQSLPPCAGAGLSQKRYLVFIPPPQTFEHGLHLDHAPQRPWRTCFAKVHLKYLHFSLAAFKKVILSVSRYYDVNVTNGSKLNVFSTQNFTCCAGCIRI